MTWDLKNCVSALSLHSLWLPESTGIISCMQVVAATVHNLNIYVVLCSMREALKKLSFQSVSQEAHGLYPTSEWILIIIIKGFCSRRFSFISGWISILSSIIIKASDPGRVRWCITEVANGSVWNPTVFRWSGVSWAEAYGAMSHPSECISILPYLEIHSRRG